MKRLSVYLSWHDLWMGVYWGADVTYICPLPFVVISWFRGETYGSQHQCDDEGRCLDRESRLLRRLFGKIR